MASGNIAGETYPERTRMGLLSRTFTPELVHLAIEETGVREERTKALPSHLVVYFTLTMWLFTHLGYGAVLRELVENFPLRKGELWRPARTGSITKARARIGQAPLRWLFDQVAGVRGTRATPGVFWRELRVMSMDGTCFDVPDSHANAAAYSRGSNGSRPGPYPQVRMVALGECGTRSLAGAVFDSFAVGERTLARRLLPYFTPGMLVTADRGFPSFTLWHDAQATGAELLWRVSDSFALPVDERLSDGTYLSRLNGRRRGERLTVRVIEYTVITTHTRADGEEEQTSELFCLITTLLQPETAPALELAELYACRWTSETIYRHIKIEQRGGRTATLRSNSPTMVEQELWAMLCVYQALRELVCDTAREHGIPPDRISFKQVLNAARRSVGTAFSPRTAPTQNP